MAVATNGENWPPAGSVVELLRFSQTDICEIIEAVSSGWSTITLCLGKRMEVHTLFRAKFYVYAHGGSWFCLGRFNKPSP
jgi:hypothetical protein